MAAQILSKEQLFAGTHFAPNMQNAIYQDILAMRQYFPTIFPYHYQYPQYATVLLQGTIIIRIDQHDVQLPLSMAIPYDFPNSPPTTQIPVDRSLQLRRSPGLRQDGIVLTQTFYQWIPRQSRLFQFVSAIGQYFSNNPPFSYQDASRLIVNSYQQTTQPNSSNSSNLAELQQQAFVEAISLIEHANQEILKAQGQYCEDMLTCDMANTIQILYEDLNDEIQVTRAELEAIQKHPLPEVTIPPEMEQNAQTVSQITAYDSVKAELKAWYEQGIINLDDYLQSIRDLSRDHFLLLVK